ncbi:MAG: DUF1223 domain-containing protein [Bacteroidia bacterium]|nr:DUF1223 domain-containing protein [Bacteroidia bacterium]
MKQLLVFASLMSLVLTHVSCKEKEDTSPEHKVSTPIKEVLVCTDKLPYAVIELFTSQGCSSCPGADNLVNSISASDTTNTLYIANHVDYWNGPLPGPCGLTAWVDPYSDAFYTQRQRGLVSKFGSSTLVTPWLQISTQYATFPGQAERKISFTSSDITTRRDELLSRPASSGLVLRLDTLNQTNHEVRIEFATLDADTSFDLELILLENNITTEITAGENCNKTLKGDHIARSWTSIPVTKHGFATLSLPENAVPENCQVAGFIKDPKNLQVYAATKGFNLLSK